MLWYLRHSRFLCRNFNRASFRRIIKILRVWETRHGRILWLHQKFWMRTFTTDGIHERSALGTLSIYMEMPCLHRAVSFLCFFFMIFAKTSKLFLFFSLLTGDDLCRIPSTGLRFTMLFFYRATFNKVNWAIGIVCNDLRTWIIMCLLTAFIFVFFIV